MRSRAFPIAATLLAAALQAQQPQTLAVDLANPAGKVSPTLYGLMTEEINYSYDGGLYAELIRNRTFHKGWDEPQHWTLSQQGRAHANMRVDDSTGPTAANHISLRLTATAADATSPVGLDNEGYWGIPVRPNTTYHAAFSAKSSTALPVTVSLVNNNTGRVVATAVSPQLSTAWQEYQLDLKTSALEASAAHHLSLQIAQPATVWFGMVSLFPPTYKNRANGNRVDLMEKLAAMNPTFLRLPGGNYLEGDHIADRFDWKKTIGPLIDRPTHPSPWRYRSSDGMGLLEFLEWCEDLRIQPVLAVYAGYSLQQEHAAPGPTLQPYVDDALDEIEYVTGDASTKWGAVRAQNGHPAPFPLTYVEIGNEDEFDRSKSYDGRFAQFYDAIKARYPKLQLIATTRVASRKPDLLDDHYYKRADEFFDFVHHYDQADRTGPKIFVGEWATREGGPTTNLGAALADAAWMTGMERNSDLIVMSSYAPLFVNVNPGGMQWSGDLIGYDAMNSYGSPSYWAQVMFGSHIGTEILKADFATETPRLFASATRDVEKGLLYLKVVNATSVPQAVTIQLKGGAASSKGAKLIELAGLSAAETNSIQDPTRVVPRETSLKGVGPAFQHTFPAYSVSVMEVPAK